VNVLGGVKVDIDAERADNIRKGLDLLEERTNHYLKIVTSDETFLRRARGVGYTTQEQAETLGLVGPTARAANVARDVRVDVPYVSYAEFPIHITLDTKGDLEARFVVRVKEMLESYRIIRAILDGLPAGELTARMPRRIKEGETVSRIEAPRGELFYFIKSGGGEKPERIKVRTPSINNFAIVTGTAIGHQLADMPMILASMDPCFSCNDR
jgi:NADH-quinone oxidoreductase subunit D